MSEAETKKPKAAEDKNKYSFVNILKLKGLDVAACNSVSDKNLKMAGFVMPTLALIIGFYKDSLSTIVFLIAPLLFAMFLFFVGSQLASEAEYYVEVLLAEIFQYIGVISLMLAFGLFLEIKIGNGLGLILVGVTLFTGAYLFKGIRNTYKFYKTLSNTTR